MASFGENLRRERELRGITLGDIAAATKISTRFLQALEQDRIDILPGGVFRRAFVREYAKFVGLDSERLVAEFVSLYTEAEPEAPRSQSQLTLPKGLLAVAGVVLLGLGLSRMHTTVATPSKARVEPPPPSPRPAERVYTPVAQASQPAGLILTLNALERCWVSVQVDGRNMLSRELEKGETETLEAAGEIVLSVGNAGGLAFRVNDHPGVSLGRSGEVRRNIVITKQNLSTLLDDLPQARPAHSS